jgi:endogenous inhibitor of DNA gyrase (YacG/DUF329 family)
MQEDQSITVNCPTCGKAVIWGPESTFRPFCCKRCRMIDFGEWASEENRIPSDNHTNEQEEWSEKDRE